MAELDIDTLNNELRNIRTQKQEKEQEQASIKAKLEINKDLIKKEMNELKEQGVEVKNMSGLEELIAKYHEEITEGIEAAKKLMEVGE